LILGQVRNILFNWQDLFYLHIFYKSKPSVLSIYSKNFVLHSIDSMLLPCRLCKYDQHLVLARHRSLPSMHINVDGTC
jgi:hypothetical protein